MVRTLFTLYAELGNLRLVEVEAECRGLRPKTLVSCSGRIRGGSPFARGQLHHLLTNPVYIGRIRHQDQSYPGQHPAIIEAGLWEDVQAKLIAASARLRGRSDTATEARILTGKLRDKAGDLLTATHTQRRGKRFAYYVSNRLICGGTDPSGWRLPAEALEGSLRQIVRSHLRRAAEGHTLLAEPDASGAAALHGKAMALVQRLDDNPALIGKIIVSGLLAQGRLKLDLDPAVGASGLGTASYALAECLLTLSQSFSLRRSGIETKIIAGETIPAPDIVLQQTLAQAHAWARDLRAGTSLTEIARKTGHSEPYIRTRIPLAFLAPRIQTAILDGRQPADFSVAQHLRDGIPMDWIEQAKLFAVG